ncbi:MAG TPA: hypothetical protein VL918_12970 [Sphingobium sp.]|nr:hypothetical protein [Sphingobium sp.]
MIGDWRAMVAGGAILAACGFALSPAVGRVDSVLGGRSGAVSLNALGSIASFTPVTSDKRLARAYAQASASARSQGFRFTPAVGSLSGRRSITIVVRAPDLDATESRPTPSVSSIGLGPVAYNLGAARGLSRFASEATGSNEADPLVPASALTLPRGFTIERRKRISTSVSVENQPMAGSGAASLAAEKHYAVDVASSLSVTRNLDVTAGIRYRDRQNRIAPLTDDARDSQAVYLGTTFKF